MAKFKIIISDPKIGTSKSVELEESEANSLIGRKVGDVVDGLIVKLPGYKILITGAVDKDGVPIRPNVHGSGRRRVVLRGGVGFNPKKHGERRRKTVRGNTISEEIVQINVKITEKPENKDQKKIA